MHLHRLATVLPAALALAACATTSPRDRAELPGGLHWYVTAAEKTALYRQVYAIAGDRILQRAAGLPTGTWAVISDADETLLDNSEYQIAMARAGQKYTEPTWYAWVRQRRAPALPGSREFVARIRSAGGTVVVVTNRAEPICEDTRANLRALGFDVAAVLCASLDSEGRMLSDKNPRFAAVQQGTTGRDLPPFKVLGYVGDNIKDFPGRSQQIIAPLEDFGVSLFLLPNPMYGSWESNALPADRGGQQPET